MISSEHALRVLEDEGCSSEVIEHVKTVTDKSVEIAKKIAEDGHQVDIELVRIGALLHDIGRSKSHDISHGVEGGRILRERGLERLSAFAENHVGAGITFTEAKELGIPPKDYLPVTIEEKIVTYSDNLVRGSQVISFTEALEEFEEELGSEHPSIERFKKLHEELRELGGAD